jgi:hypothetical protein
VAVSTETAETVISIAALRLVVLHTSMAVQADKVTAVIAVTTTVVTAAAVAVSLAVLAAAVATPVAVLLVNGAHTLPTVEAVALITPVLTKTMSQV